MENITFEQAIERLQTIVLLLEKGEVSLDESVELFKEGSHLSALCHKKLNSAQQKITKLGSEFDTSED